MVPCKYFWPDQDKWTSFWNKNVMRCILCFVFSWVIFWKPWTDAHFSQLRIRHQILDNQGKLIWISTFNYNHIIYWVEPYKFINLTFFISNYFFLKYFSCHRFFFNIWGKVVSLRDFFLSNLHILLYNFNQPCKHHLTIV